MKEAVTPQSTPYRLCFTLYQIPSPTSTHLPDSLHAPFAIVSPCRPCMNVSPPPSARCGPASIYGVQQNTPALQPGHAKSTTSRPLPFFMGLPPGRIAQPGKGSSLFASSSTHSFCLSFSNRRPVRSFLPCPSSDYARALGLHLAADSALAVNVWRLDESNLNCARLYRPIFNI